MYDKAIEFESTKIKVNKKLKMMKEANLNIEKYEEIYQKIITTCNTDNKTIPDSIINSDTNFATDCLTTNYSKGINALELLDAALSKYEIYVQVSSFTIYLKEFINKQNKLPNDFNIYRESLIDIINRLIKSNTLDYDVEGNIIEEIYEIAYYFIKEEISVLGYSETLKELKENKININYIDKQIVRDLEKINFKDPKYNKLSKTKNKIDSLGFNSTYVNEDLLKELVRSNLSHEEITELIDTLNKQIKENLNKIENKPTLIDKGHTKDIKYYKKNIVKQIALFITSTSIMASLSFGSIKASRLKKYYNTTTTYSPKTGITTIGEYKYTTKNETFIYEMTPYKKELIGNNFKRKETKYNVSEIKDIPIEEYLNIDLNSLGIANEIKTNYKESLTLEDTYEETIRYVEQITVDLNNWEKEIDPNILVISSLCSALVELATDFLFYVLYFNEDKKYPSFLSAIIKIIENIKKIKKSNLDEKEYTKKVKEINEKYEELLSKNKDLIKELLDYYEVIKNNPEYNEEIKKIEKTLKLIK